MTIVRSAISGRQILFCLIALLFTARPNQAQTGGSIQIPKTIADWKMELVADAPKIKHPSVVCSTPDGRIFVAEDPMDISAPADASLGRIQCFHPDGKVTLFADGLFAVFGMQYLEGKLYVLHNPKFSVFRDENGVGKDRIDLIESTNPNPWALDWNDHVPANFRLGMDGYFYVAVGDKGIFGAVGKDGKRVDLHGGGILRLRPDGTELEIYSTGVRNILDVAMNEEDEIFTYDNTDEQQWMGRVTHMVDGGFYGYPYDFIPQRPYTLWMLADYGGGAATGTLCYNEDALPYEYFGNLFLADFGKRQIMRVQVSRNGGSYEARSKTDLFMDPPPDFRPVGISWSSDAKSIYICDWNHRDNKANVEVGRLWKLSYTGKAQAAAKPAWFLPAATGKTFETNQTELIEGLSHSSRQVRMTAQRKLAEMGIPAVKELTKVLTNGNAPARARIHALWAMDGIDQGIAARQAILKATQDASLTVRRQAIRQLGSRKVTEAAEPLMACLNHNDASIRLYAATALGRIALPQAISPLLAALEQHDLFARYAALKALNRIGLQHPDHWETIVKGLDSDSARIREGTQFSIRETYQVPLVQALDSLIHDESKSLTARTLALHSIAELHRQTPTWKGEWWAYHPVNSPPPPKNVSWEGTETILATLRKMVSSLSADLRKSSVTGILHAHDTGAAPILLEQFRRETELDIQRGILLTLGKLKSQVATELIVSMIRDPQRNQVLLRDALEAAQEIGIAEASGPVLQLLQASSGNRENIISSIRTLGGLKSEAAVPTIAQYANKEDAGLREPALEALVKVGSERAFHAMTPLFESPLLEIRKDAIRAAGQFKTRNALPFLIKAYQNAETQPEALAALTLSPDLRALEFYLTGLVSKNATLREQCSKAVRAIRAEAFPSLERKVDQLSPAAIAELQRIYKDAPEAANSKLLNAKPAALDVKDYEEFALGRTGDAERGRRIFEDTKGVACAKCHIVDGQGGKIGPDLTNIGAQFGRAALIESILSPSKVIREGYQPTVIETKEDEAVSGLFAGETESEIRILDADSKLHRIPKSKISTRRTSELSMMPEGLHAGLSLEEFGDLIAYLESLKKQ